MISVSYNQIKSLLGRPTPENGVSFSIVTRRCENFSLLKWLL